ncbi:hypothetical protein ACNKHR_18045 [Shigella flexneri]
MHGPQEVAFANKLFTRIETMLVWHRYPENGHYG